MARISEKLDGDQATLEEFALYFLDNVAVIPRSRAQFTARKIADILKRNLNVGDVTILGSGSFGSAGRIGGKSETIKLTSDPQEVDSAARLLGVSLPNVVRFRTAAMIHNVSFRNQFDDVRQAGVTIQTYLDEVGLGSSYNDELDHVTAEVKMKHRVLMSDLKGVDEAEARDRLFSASADLADRLLALERPISDIGAGVEQLHMVGVYFVDSHHGNVGLDYRDGVHKIFDLGLSSVREKVDAPVLRGKRK